MTKQQPRDEDKFEGSEIDNLQTHFQKQKQGEIHIGLNLGKNDFGWQHTVRPFIFLIFQVPVMILRGSIKFSKQLNAAFFQTIPYPKIYIPYSKWSGFFHQVVIPNPNNKEQ